MNFSEEDILYDDFSLFEEGSAVKRVAVSLKAGDINTFLRGMCALFARIGFIFVHAGCIPVENIQMIVFHNIIEIGLSMVCYGILGYRFSFGPKSRAGVIGGSLDLKATFRNVIAGLSSSLIGMAQMSTFLAGRIHMGGAMLITFLYCTIIQPLLIQWVWDASGWMAKSKDYYVMDYGGNLVIHMPSTAFGLVGALFLGRRLVRLRDVDEFSFASVNAVGTTLGYIAVICGYIGITIPWKIRRLGVVLSNDILALGTGITVVIVLHRVTYKQHLKYWILLRCLQGGVAAMITTGPRIQIYEPWQIFILATIGAIVFFFCSLAIHNTAIEDPCNMIASHLVCGFLGSFLCPLFEPEKVLWKFLWQFTYILVVIVFTIAFAAIIFTILYFAKFLRNHNEIDNHNRAVNVWDNLPKRGYLERLLMIDDTATPHIIPGSFRKKFVPDPTKSNPDNRAVRNVLALNKDFKDDKKKHQESQIKNDKGKKR